MTQRSGAGISGGTQDITYTPFNLPEKITFGSSGTGPINYEYNADQQRVLLSIGAPGATTDQRIYVGSGYERQITTDAQGAVTRHLYKVMAGGKQVAQVQREVRGATSTPTTRYIHSDHLGSSQLVTNESGTLVHLQRFDPFGAAIDPASSSPDGATKQIRAGFTGHESDVETGLINMRGRIYDPRIGRFLQADPPFMESPFWSQGLNPYSYVFNNPMNYVDPSGFEADGPETYDRTEDDGTMVFGDDPLRGGGYEPNEWDEGAEDEAEVARDAEQRAEAASGEGAQAADQEALDEYWARAHEEDRENAARGQHNDLPGIDDFQTFLDVTSVALDSSGVGAAVSWVPDVVNIAIDAIQGDKEGIAFSVPAVLPFIGIAGNLAHIAKHADEVADATKGVAPRVVEHVSEDAARRAALRQAGIPAGTPATRTVPSNPGSQAATGPRGTRAEWNPVSDANVGVHHDPNGHLFKDGSTIAPHYGLDIPGSTTIHHTYPSSVDPRLNR